MPSTGIFIAPKLAKDMYKREFHIISHQLEQSKGKLEAILGPGETIPKQAELRENLKTRRDMILKGNDLAMACSKMLDKLDTVSNQYLEESKIMKNQVVDKLNSVFPTLRDQLKELVMKQNGELYRLSQECRSYTSD